ncbi:MAG TPA: TonB family protein [Kofleriaceae bacterium]|nr:TonB family protein [Kofleriaceae bacterium]
MIATVGVSTPLMSASLTAARRAAAKRPATARELVVGCEADATLASVVKVAMCASPFGGKDGAEACARDARKTLELDLIRCHEDPDAAGLEIVDLSQIDFTPKPLLPDVKPVDDVVAAELIEKEVAEKVEQAQKAIEKPPVNGQVVEITRPQVELPPDQARYLSEYDSRADKQTVARGSTEKMVERPSPKEMPATATETPPDQKEATAKEVEKQIAAVQPPGKAQGPGSAPTTLSMRGPGTSQESPAIERTSVGDKTGELAMSEDGYAAKKGQGGDLSRATELTPPGGAEGGGGLEPPKTPNLRVSQETMERVVGGGSVDHVEDAEEGDFTALNSRKWKYATFFNRMKRQVAQNWHPDVVYLRRDPNGNIYGNRDRLTVLRVSLKPNGAVAKIYVAKRSGVDFLDDEAVRAFEEAQPFPNPPSGLVDLQSNLITFSFGFHFQLGSDRSRWKVFRYQ